MSPTIRSFLRYASLVWLVASHNHLTSAQSPSGPANERSKLLDGLSAIPKLGAPSPIAIWGPNAFPVFAGGEIGKPEIALAAASVFGKGRILLIGHNSYLSPEAGAEIASGTFLHNAIKWVTAKPSPRIGIYASNANSFLESKGYTVKKLTGNFDKNSLTPYDVLVLNAQSVTSETDGSAILEFVSNGAGLIAGMTGWAFEQTSGGKRLNTGHGLNRALAATGIAFTDASGFEKQGQDFPARNNLPATLNALTALDAIQQQTKSGPELSPADWEQAGSAIQLALIAQPSTQSPFSKSVLTTISGGGIVPTEKAPLTQTKDAAERNRLGIETRVLKLADVDDIQAHPSAKAFPGEAPADAERISRVVSINPDIPGWTSTGLWVNAGDRITVRCPANMVGKGYAIRIGCHTDALYHLDKWMRAPEITRTIAIESEVTRAANAFGGLIYIEVPGRAKGTAPFSINITNAIEAPIFVLGRDDDAKWNTVLKNHNAPWAEFACDKVILICPAENARRVTNPTELMHFWTKVVDAQDEISNQAKDRKRPERIVCDVQISAGYMHSGYPIMVPVSAADEMITYGGGKAPGWGFYHELGHNHQRGDFTFEGTGEVTNNVLGMYVFHHVLSRDPLTGHTAISPEKLRANISLIQRLGDKFPVWKKEPFLALTTYIQLIEGFGWDAWRRYLYSFSDPAFGSVPKDDDQKRDQFLVRYSKITQKNLSAFFDFWGIPVSPSAKAAVENLEPWMPPGIPGQR